METGRILLRAWDEGDAEALYKYASDPEVGPRAGWPPHKSVEESREIIRTLFGGDHMWAMVLKETGELIGCMGYFVHGESNINIGENDAEVGYWVASPYWNQGLCSETLRVLIDYCFNVKGFSALWADYFPENPASGRVMEKCGFSATGEVNTCSRLQVGSDRPVRIMRLTEKTFRQAIKGDGAALRSKSNNMKNNIALVMGGYSGEHAISIASGHQVYGQLDHTKYNVYKIVIDREGWYWDCDGEHLPVDRGDFTVSDNGRKVCFDLAFIIVHGNPGENGVLQGYFDMLGIRYTTCGFYTSALTFQKGYCNPVVKSFGLVKVAKSVLLYKEPPTEGKLDELMEGMRYPVFVKPAAGGSSVATTKVKSREQLLPAIREAFTEDRQVLVEEFIPGREFDCGVMQFPKGSKYEGWNPDFKHKLVFPVTEIIPIGGHEFFDYAAKYDGFSNEVCPAQVDDAIAHHIQEVSYRLYDLLGCRGIVRFDFIYNTEEQELYFLEVNTIPGQSAESIVPKQARAMGITPAELYQMAIDAALD